MESSSRAHHRWILGRYVQLVSLLQLTVYAIARFADQPNAFLPALDPRFLVHLVFDGPGPGGFPSGWSLVSAIALFFVGEGIVHDRIGLIVYVAVEGVYSALFVLLAVGIVAANGSGAHVLAASELIVPFAVFTVASAVPLLVALPLWRAPDYGDRSATSG
jgi:hypothetical protein